MLCQPPIEAGSSNFSLFYNNSGGGAGPKTNTEGDDRQEGGVEGGERRAEGTAQRRMMQGQTDHGGQGSVGERWRRTPEEEARGHSVQYYCNTTEQEKKN